MKRIGRRLGACLGILLATVALVGGGGPVAGAESGSLSIRAVDTTAFPDVRITALSGGEAPSYGDFTLRENGTFVEDFDLVPVSDTDTQLSTVLVLDVSGSMANGDAITQAKAAAVDFVNQSDPSMPIALVTFGDQARTVSSFSTNHDYLISAIDGLGAAGETALWDGVRTGVGLYTDRPELQPNLVVLSDGADTVSTTTQDQAIAAAKGANAAVFTVGIVTAEFDDGAVRTLADETGGTYTGVTDPNALGDIYRGIQASLANQYEIRYASTSQDATLELVLAADGHQASATVNTGTKSEGASTSPEVVDSGGGVFSGTLGLVLGVAGGVIAAGLFAYGILLVFQKDDRSLEHRLSHYDEGASATGDDDSDANAMFQTPMMQRAVTFTEDLARDRGFLPKVELMMEQADLPLRPAEALLAYAGIAVVVSIAGFFLAGSFVVALGVAVLAVLGPPAVARYLGARRRKKFVAVLPDTLELLASSLRAGYSLMQGVEAVSQEAQEPMGKELRRVVAEARLGRNLEESLDDTAERMGSPDFSWAVMAIRIQREVGGNLSELLQTVGQTMLARERLRREVSALTAEGRMSAIVLGLLPLGLGLAIKVMNPEYLEPLFHGTGAIILLAACGWALIGFWWMWRMIQIDV